MTDMKPVLRVLLCLALGAAGSATAGHVSAQETWDGVTKPIALAPYDPHRPACAKPPGLRRTLVFAQDNSREFMEGTAAGLKAAARDRDLEFLSLLADNDPDRMIAQVDEARHARAGALVAAPIDAQTLAPSLKAMIKDGSYVGTVVPPPAVTILNAPQYLTGQVLGDAAVAYISSKLGGKARVVLLTHDSNQYLAQRFVAIRKALDQLPGVTIVADISPVTVNTQGGYETMRKVLIAQSDVDVVLGADTVVLGALAAVRESGHARPDQFFGGIDGEPEALVELKKGGEYKASVGLASPVFGYAMGQQAADWLDGKSIPQAMDVLPVPITPETIAQYEADLADPAAVYRDDAKRDAYLKMYGNICYETRDQFLNFPWSSERN